MLNNSLIRVWFPQLAIIALGCVASRTPAFAARNDEVAAFRDGNVLVAFRPDVPPDRQKAILAGVGAAKLKDIGVGVHVLSVGKGRELGAIQALKARGEIRYAEPDYLHALDGGSLPNDTSVGIQWAVQNTGQNVNGIVGKPGADERLTAAWAIATGSSATVVAVLDSGVQYSHPDLITNMWVNPGGIGGCPAGTHGYDVLNATCDPMDDEITYGGHGTHVAGILGATGNNGAGVAGVNWTASIMAVKWVSAAGSGATSDLISAMDWVVQAKQAGVNVRVANDSATWPGTGFSQALSDEIDLLGSNDILLVAAAGNTAQNDDTIPRYPCSYNRPNMLCAAASDQNDKLWSSSNFGTTTVKLAAPGVNIYSTKRLSNYGYISGCSMAAPQVAGTAALVLSAGYQSVANLRSTLLSSVDLLPSLTNFVATGGRLNVCKALPGCASAIAATPSMLAGPVVTGVPQYGSLLGASTGMWSGVPANYAYQWYRCGSGGSNCLPIPGAASQTYAVLASEDAGATLLAAVTASNAFGSSTALSLTSAYIAPELPPFAIASTIQDGQNVGGHVTWQATPAQAVNFVQFYIDGALSQTTSSSPYIYNQGTTGLFDPSALSIGTHVLGIRALSSDNRTYGFYGATITVTNAPRNSTPPVISGSPSPGQSLSTSNGLWSNNPISYTYQWNRCDAFGGNCSAIPGATGISYLVSRADAGLTLRSAVTAANSAGSSTVMSAAISISNPGGGGSIFMLQATAAEGSGVQSVSAAFPASNTAGNLIVAFVRMSTATQTVTVSDSRGNAYIDAVSQAQTADGHQIHVFYAKNIAGGANTVTAAFSAANNHPWLAIYEYSGLSATAPLDRTAHAQGSGSSPSSGATSATASANELIFSGLGVPYSSGVGVSAGGGYTMQQQDTNTSPAANEAAVVSASGSYAGTFSLNSGTNWCAVIATFVGSGGSVAQPSVTTNALPAGTQNAPYSATLAATGGTAPYTWSLAAGSLPSGLTLAPGTGAISGTPIASGTSSFTVQVSDANSQTAQKPLSIAINPAGGTGIALLQSNSAQGASVASVSVPFPSANGAGNLIVAFVRMSSATQTVTVSDGAGNLYTEAVAQTQTSDGHQAHIFYAKNIAGGVNTVSAAFSAANNHPWLAVYEYSGLSATNPLDRTAHAQGGNSAPNSGSAAATASGKELLFAGAGFPYSYSGTVAAGGGFILQQQDTATSRAASEAAIVASPGSYAGTFSLSPSTNWSAVAATFKP
ncbi:MAG: S8 family serine peptidase [Bryobacteraceae bacterium]